MPIYIALQERCGPGVELVRITANGDGLPLRCPDRISEPRVRVGAALKGSHQKHLFDDLRLPAGVEPDRLSAGNDLGIALAMLGDTDEAVICHGEFGLDGKLRGARGTFAAVEAAMAFADEKGLPAVTVLVAEAAAREAGLAAGFRNFREGVRVHSLRDVADLNAWRRAEFEMPAPYVHHTAHEGQAEDTLCFSELRGNAEMVEGLCVAAILGDQRVLLVGPAGAGKTMAARRALGLFGPLSVEERREVLRMQYAAGLGLQHEHIGPIARPFRAPYHTISDAALIGGGVPVRGGELTLANHGVLFLDELPEFRRQTLAALRAPLKSGKVTIRRRDAEGTFPAKPVMAIAAANACPCGGLGGCECSPSQIARYRARTAPFDATMVLRVDPVPLSRRPDMPSTAGLRACVRTAKEKLNVLFTDEALTLGDQHAEPRRTRIYNIARALCAFRGEERTTVEHMTTAVRWTEEILYGAGDSAGRSE